MARLGRSSRWILLALAVLALAAIAQAGSRESSAARWADVERRTLAIEVPVVGRVRAPQVAEYGPPQLTLIWEYRISFLAPEGDVVAAGEPVLRFDTTELEQRLRRHLGDRDVAAKAYDERRKEYEAEVSEQQLAFEEAKAEERRAQISADIPRELVARSALEKARVDLELARGELAHRTERIQDLDRRSKTELGVLRDRRDRAGAAVAEIERSIELMTVRANGRGTVSYRPDRRGNKKKVGDSCWRGDRVLEIPAPGALRIEGWIKESDSGDIRVGLPATLWLEAHPDRSFSGKVEKLQQTVERHSEIDPGPIVRVELSFDGAGTASIRSGMRIQGKVVLERRPEQLAVRTAAVIAGPAGPTVVIKSLFGTETRAVQLGARSGDWVEILEGVTADDRVWMQE